MVDMIRHLKSQLSMLFFVDSGYPLKILKCIACQAFCHVMTRRLGFRDSNTPRVYF